MSTNLYTEKPMTQQQSKNPSYKKETTLNNILLPSLDFQNILLNIVNSNYITT